MTAFEHLFSPVSIGTMSLKNRIVMSPMTTDYGSDEQEPTERLLAYLEERARGGVGLITVEVCSVALEHRYQLNSLSLAEDRFIAAHRKLTDRLHRHDVKLQPQITHPGPESLAPFFSGTPSIGPSVNVNPSGFQSSRPLAIEEMPVVIDQYAQAAIRAKAAGYDGMELHAAHAYMLLGSFLSPLRNGRRDAYGGKKLQGRARLLLETLTAIKQAVGPEFPVTVSLSGFERFPGGRDINETQCLAQLLEAAGADALRISGGTTDLLVSQMVMGSDYPDAINTTAAESVRQVVNVPVMVVGRIHTPELGEKIIASGQADLVAMGRPFLADPHWPNKIKAGKRQAMRRCISCENCIDSMIEQQNMNCAVNGATGRELDQAPGRAPVSKRVLVIGGGPAGMEAARLSSLRGHNVTLLERQRCLGGSLRLAATVHADNEPFLSWLIHQLNQSAVDVRLATAATPALIHSLMPDAIIVATGAQVQIPDIEGIELPHVYTGAQLRRIVEGRADSADFAALPPALRPIARSLTPLVGPRITPKQMRRVSRYWLPLGNNVVVIGADLAAIELAEFLAKRGRKVSVLEAGQRIAVEIGPKRRAEHALRLDQLGVTICTEARCEKIDAHAVHFRNATDQPRQLAADSVIVAGTPVAATELFDSVTSLAEEVHAIGDCTGLGLIRKATAEAMKIAYSL